MAQRTINSPGVEIRESDLSFTAPAAGGTSVYITGFAQQGPIDEVLLIPQDDRDGAYAALLG